MFLDNGKQGPGWQSRVGRRSQRQPVRPSLEHLEDRLAPALSVAGSNLTAPEGVPFNGVVATFTDTSPASPSSYAAVINWGDGILTSGTVASPSTNSFTVSGTHTYAEVGSFTPVAIVIKSDGTMGTSAFVTQTNLVSNGAAPAAHTDANLVNPWGIVAGPTTFFWINDNGTGLATTYTGDGTPQSIIVTIPPPAGSPPGTTAAPTGIVFNSTSDFSVPGGPAHFLFATEDGTISGWNNGSSATLEVDNSASSAVYKGLAEGNNGSGNFLYATNFRAGTIDVFNSSFQQVHLSGSFTDPNIPAGFAPFGIANINGQLFVTYALQNAEKHDDVAGPGNGFVDVFDTNGNLLRRFASNGTLNSPWGMTLAPANFGQFSNDLLVGDFGDGRINAFNPTTGTFLGQLTDASNTPVTIQGLWGLTFGNGGKAGATNTLFFTAGINGEADGLFGSLSATASTATVTEAAPTTAIGVYESATGQWLLRNELSSGGPDAANFQYGFPGTIPVTGDWTGTGQTGIGVYVMATGEWLLRNSPTPGAPQFDFFYGGAGLMPVTGDWNGTGHTGIGVFDPTTGEWLLRNEVSAGAPDAGNFFYGGSGMTPVTGDWTGTGHSGIGVYVNDTGEWLLRNEVSAGAPDAGDFFYGGAGLVPVTGDWTGTGHTGIGVYGTDSGQWLLRNEVSAGAPDAANFQYGGTGLVPVTGHWTALSSTPTSSPSAATVQPPPTAGLDTVLTAVAQSSSVVDMLLQLGGMVRKNGLLTGATM
jgi:uncharacterized protein (TIGR03118 family)